MKQAFFVIAFLSVLGVSGQVSKSFFGTHIGGPLENNLAGQRVNTLWPTTNPTSVRIWNTWGYNPNKQKYDYLFWRNINTGNGVYDWGLFDKVIDSFKARNVSEMVYAIGYTPAWAGGNAEGTNAPSDTALLSKFVRALAARAIARGWPIRNWEIWNEPNGSAHWTGTAAEMVPLAKAVYQAVKAVDPSYKVVSPSPQGSGADYWMGQYLQAGGGQWCDAIAFHGYINFYQTDALQATQEKFEQLIYKIRNLMTKYNVGTKELWDTEGFDLFTCGGTCYDYPSQAAYLAQRFLVSAARGLSRVFWYAWDQNHGKQWGNETGSFQVNEVGLANEKIMTWMQGATVDNLVVASGVYTVDVTRNGVTSKAVWTNSGTLSYATTYTQYETLGGTTGTISGGTVSISRKPILLKGTNTATLSGSSTSSYRINSGGAQLSTTLGTFSADNSFSPAPGASYATNASISGTSNPGLYQKERYGTSFGYALPLANGQYNVVLHFAEIYYTTAGNRVFDVSLEGQKVLDNYDIVARAGAFTATTQSFTVNVSDGVLNINFSSLAADGGKDNAKISAIEVVPAATATYRINSGGAQLSTTLGTFSADNSFSPAPGASYATNASISGTSNPGLYQKERYGTSFGYALPLANGQYNVVLHFAEIYYTTAGNRVFDVSLEGQKVLDNYDIVARAGAFTATTQSFTVNVSDGVLNINFSSLAADGGKDNAKISAIEVVPTTTNLSSRQSVAASTEVTPGGNATSTLAVQPLTIKALTADAFPNPSTSYFNIKVQGSSEEPVVMNLIDLSGRVVQTKTGISINTTLQIGNNLPPGMYVVEVVQGKQRVQRKITKM